MFVSVPIALFIWPMISLCLFALLKPHRAVIANFVAGWLLLPVASIPLAYFPDVSKLSTMAVGALLGVLLFDTRRLVRFRPTVLDAAALVLTTGPLATSVANGLGFYDGLSRALSNFLIWGTPWLMGRLYASAPGVRRDLMLGLLIGSLAYVPICLFEMRFSPQLHRWVYGFTPFPFYTVHRFGGYRPVGFLRHGIEFGMLMMSGSLIALWLAHLKTRQRVLGIPIGWVAAILVTAALLTRALGSWILLAIGVFVLFGTRTTRSGILIALLLLTPITYAGARSLGIFQGDVLVALAENVSKERAASLNTRFYHEGQLTGKALERPVLGWGGWSRNRIHNERGENASLTDGLWIIMLGQSGFVGLGSWLAMMLAAPMLILRRVGARRLLLPASAPVLILMVLLPLQTIDWIFNGFVNPVTLLMAGSLVEASRTGRRGRSPPAGKRGQVRDATR